MLKQAKSVTDRHDLSEWNDFKKRFSSKKWKKSSSNERTSHLEEN
ncbi:hypothetical protein HPHPH6_0427 [Helicobacter pylori Hp H-6]|uniref:Uncharacterized protein n=1 Tax=Helicobacter pylori Hp H-6 TaxID=992061 RepID=I9UN72_HELPX|nr:hypothetical protein HPHPH6_0427 [Helicobacter pylori Hp H-6]